MNYIQHQTFATRTVLLRREETLKIHLESCKGFVSWVPPFLLDLLVFKQWEFSPFNCDACPEKFDEELQGFARDAEEIVDHFVKLVPEQSSKTELETLLAGSGVAKKMEVGEEFLVMLYDTKCAGEASSHCHLRYPQFRQHHLKNAVQAMCATRGQQQLSEQEIVLVLDGGRAISSSIMAAFITEDGNQFENKCRSEFLIHYEEKALRERKQLQRGILQLHESIHALGVLKEGCPRPKDP